MQAHVVFVHIGGDLPAHAHAALAQARRFTGGPVTLVTTDLARERCQINPGLRIETVTCESLGLSRAHEEFRRISPLDREFREGFWTHTTERFFYLETLMRALDLEDVIHLENDVMLYEDVASLLPVLRRNFAHVAATFDAPDRCIPGFVYIRDAGALTPLAAMFNELLGGPSGGWSDMALIAEYRRRHPDRIGRLPVVTPDYPHPLRSAIDPVVRPLEEYAGLAGEFGGIFDAAALGQYLGGVDSRNSPEPDTRGFINETAVFDPSHYAYRWKVDAAGRRVPRVVLAEREWKILDLHVHSKTMAPFIS